MLLFISWKMEYKKRLNAIFMRLKAFLMALENLEDDDPFSQKNTFFRKIYRNTKMSRIFSFVGHETSFVWKYSSGNDKNEPTMTSKGVFGQKLDNFAWTKYSCRISMEWQIRVGNFRKFLEISISMEISGNWALRWHGKQCSSSNHFTISRWVFIVQSRAMARWKADGG